MKKSILLLLSVLWAASFCNAQETLSAGVRLQFNAPVAPFSTGHGNGGALWLNKAISKRSNLSLSLGYQHYAGLGTGYIEESERIGPTQIFRSVETSILDALSFLTIDGAYRLDAARSPWAFSLGFRLARRVQFRGESTLQTRNRATFLEPGISLPNNVDIISNTISSSTTLTDRSEMLARQLNPIDAGLQLGVHYRLSKGISAEAGVYQGLLNQWLPEFKGEGGYWITAFSLGLSARIF
jgi:hypothetical protein